MVKHCYEVTKEIISEVMMHIGIKLKHSHKNGQSGNTRLCRAVFVEKFRVQVQSWSQSFMECKRYKEINSALSNLIPRAVSGNCINLAHFSNPNVKLKK